MQWRPNAMDDAVLMLEQRAERGIPRGAAAVLEQATSEAAIERLEIPMRRTRPRPVKRFLGVGVLIVMAALLAGLLVFSGHSGDRARVSTPAANSGVRATWT